MSSTSPASDGGDRRDYDDPLDSPEGYEYHRERADDVWTHRETGLEVRVRKNARPDQMHTPETSKRMEGFESKVRGGPENVAEPLSANDLGNRPGQHEIVEEFMAAFPDGEYVPKLPGNSWDWGRVRWRDVVDDGEGADR